MELQFIKLGFKSPTDHAQLSSYSIAIKQNTWFFKCIYELHSRVSNKCNTKTSMNPVSRELSSSKYHCLPYELSLFSIEIVTV